VVDCVCESCAVHVWAEWCTLVAVPLRSRAYGEGWFALWGRIVLFRCCDPKPDDAVLLCKL